MSYAVFYRKSGRPAEYVEWQRRRPDVAQRWARYREAKHRRQTMRLILLTSAETAEYAHVLDKRVALNAGDSLWLDLDSGDLVVAASEEQARVMLAEGLVAALLVDEP